MNMNVKATTEEKLVAKVLVFTQLEGRIDSAATVNGEQILFYALGKRLESLLTILMFNTDMLVADGDYFLTKLCQSGSGSFPVSESVFVDCLKAARKMPVTEKMEDFLYNLMTSYYKTSFVGGDTTRHERLLAVLLKKEGVQSVFHRMLALSDQDALVVTADRGDKILFSLLLALGYGLRTTPDIVVDARNRLNVADSVKSDFLKAVGLS